MKTMKVALLATAALAAVSVSARADDTAAIKAQLEALTARIAQLEAAPAVPVGYSLLTISEAPAYQVPGLEVLNKDAAAAGDTVTRIGIMPTADVPASTTIDWSGYARAAIVYSDYDSDDNPSEDFDDIDVYARGQIKVTGKTDTAVGEVGATIEFRGNFDGQRESSDRVYIEQAWGWWAMTPELTLGGGFAGSLGNIGYGYDGACNCYYTDNADVALNPGDRSQMRLTYASGPLSVAVAVEDATGSNAFAGDGDALGVAAEIKYSGDTVNGELSAVWRGDTGTNTVTVAHGDHTHTTTNGQSSWQVGAGLGFALGDMASLSIGAAFGETIASDFWGVSALASANLSDTVHGEVAVGYKEYSDYIVPIGGGFVPDREVLAVLAGIYYDPVPQLTIGVEGEWSETTQSHFNPGNGDYVQTSTSVDLVTIFRF
jgi:opacity protein-like surface antigen